jgi:hypothetical protein
MGVRMLDVFLIEAGEFKTNFVAHQNSESSNDAKVEQ